MARSERRNKRRRRGRRSRRIAPLLVIGAGLALVAGALLALVLSSNRAPRLLVEQEVYDYGVVMFETPIMTVFTIRNEGNAPLRVAGTPQVEVREGC